MAKNTEKLPKIHYWVYPYFPAIFSDSSVNSPEMFGKIFQKQIPFSLAFLIILLISATSAGLFFIFRNKIYQYQLYLQDDQNASKVFSLEYGSLPQMSEESFFTRVKNQLVSDKANFIEANLSEMELSFYDRGEPVKQYKIIGKGKEGSWWETPAGIYKIETKEKVHFSSIGAVYMPYSMQFQGNFFIHGIPYYPDGKETSLSYTGGCIKLLTQDAKEIFELSDLGIPVLVFEKDFQKDSFVHELQVPKVSAEAYLAADLKNNFVFFEKNSNSVLPIASLTKLMTAVVSTEYINLEKEITVTQAMLAPTSVPRLKIGQSYKAYDLLFPLMTESSNEAAQALSYFLGPQRFIDLMNQKGRALDMSSTVFADSSGISPVSAASSKDLFSLAKYLYFNRNFVLKLSNNAVESSAYGTPKFTNLSNFNKSRNNRAVWDNFVGGKVGLTQASKQTIVSIFEIEIRGEKRPIAVIVLGTNNNYGDVEEIVSRIKVFYQ